MTGQRIEIGDGFHLAPVELGDKPAYLTHFADPVIGRMMLSVPVPYTETDADKWIAHRLSNARGREIQIRNSARRRFSHRRHRSGRGAIDRRLSRRDRVLAGARLCGRGLMPRAIRVFADYAFRELQLHKLSATTYPFNPSPSRALEKAGFALEGRLREHVRSRKGNEYFDALVYGLVSPG